MSISVCMATRNGHRFLREQLQSIVDQLGTDDEIIIVDDGSTDTTVDTIKAFADPRISLHVNERWRGEVFSFGRAIELSGNQIVFLADQDDIWLPGRVARMRSALQSVAAVATNFDWIDSDGAPLAIRVDGVRPEDSQHSLKNIADIFIGRTRYFGCAMAFRRELIRLITPIPDYVESHDLWIALAANVLGSICHLDAPSLLKRQHSGNATGPVSARSLRLKLRSRGIFARSIVTLRRRLHAIPPASSNTTTPDAPVAIQSGRRPNNI